MKENVDTDCVQTKSSATIENMFPESLREQILQKVQFSTTSRMDELGKCRSASSNINANRRLVNIIFEEFKHEFFPGEEVTVIEESGEQLLGVIREKAKFPMIRAADGSVQREPFSRYFVRIKNSTEEEALADDKHVRRDRKVFTKQNLRSFLKNSLQRENWNGAPWLVKEHLAIHYRLPMEIPAHLLQDARLLQNKQQMLQMRPHKGKKVKHQSELNGDGFAGRDAQGNLLGHTVLQQHQQQQQQHPGVHSHQLPRQNGHHAGQARQQPPVVIKYPIEDLDIAPKRNGTTRPELKFFTQGMADYIKGDCQHEPTDIEMESMGMLLEVWCTLNVQCEVYKLDSFTFDDFVDAMRFQSVDVKCELLEEIHCAVLGMFIDESGKVQVKDLPKKAVTTVVDESEILDISEASTPIPDAPARSTRSRLSHVESAADQAGAEKGHRASEMIAERGWLDRLIAHDYEDGGWQVIIIGILHQLSANSKLKEKCERILTELAPIDLEPTRETALEQYATLDINLRIAALQMLVVLTIRTDTIKDSLEQCMEDMTETRKRKIDFQRAKKAAMEEFATKDQDRKILLPDHLEPDSPKQEESLISVEPDAPEDSINGSSSTPDRDEETATGRRSLRGDSSRKRKRDEDIARREKEKAEKAEAAKAQNKSAKAWNKVLKDLADIQSKILGLEDQIAECDADLREANVQRTKVLGKDRFCNRYYWFERNGQPFGGLPTSSTASYGYANGRIWVQGPDSMEIEGFIERTKEEQAEYRNRFGSTVPERRQQEEGTTILKNAHQWGFYDDPDRLDHLIGWLDDRGEREKKLRKELVEWRDKISEYMVAYRKFHSEEAAKKIEGDEENASRITTRHKIQEEQKGQQERCLKWQNNFALDELGHLHSEWPKPAEKKSKAPPKGSKNTKPTTRQGEKYAFK